MSESLQFASVREDYLNHIRHERNLSENTYYSYKSHLQRLESWLGTNGHPSPVLFREGFTTQCLRKYLYYLSESGLRPRTIRSVFNAVRGIGAFAEENGLLSNNPSLTIRLPKKDAAERLLVSTGELTVLLEACDRQRNPATATISKAMFSVLIFCGLRSAELLDLKVSDINIGGKTLLVAHGKGDKSRVLYPPDECLEALSKWLQIRPNDHPTTWLWAYGKDRRYAEHGLHSLLETVKATAGLAGRDNIKPHSIRHAFATRMMENKADIKSIQAALGHSDANVTLLYLHASEQPAKAMAELGSIKQAVVEPVVEKQIERKQKGSISKLNRMRRHPTKY